MPNPRTPFDKDEGVVRRRFLGFTRDEAAKGLVSTGEASNAMAGFIDLAASDGLMKAADTYEVRDLVEGLLNNAKEMRAHDLTIPDARVGIEELALMDRIGVPPGKRAEVVKALGAIVKAPNPKKVLNTAIELTRHVDEQHLSYADAVANYDDCVAKIRRKEEEERSDTTKNAQTKEAEIRRISNEEQAKVKRTTEAETKNLVKVRNDEETRTRKAREDRARLDAEIRGGRKTVAQLSHDQEGAERNLRSIKEEKQKVLARAGSVEQMDATFSKLGITKPEEEAAVLREVGNLGGDPRRIIELLRTYGGIEKGLKKATALTAAERRKVRDVRTAFRRETRYLEKIVQKGQKEHDELTTLTTERRRAKSRLKYVTRGIAKVERVDATLKGLNGAIAAKQTADRELQVKITDGEGRLGDVLHRVAEAEGVEESIAGLNSARARAEKEFGLKKTELDEIVKKIAQAHGADATLEGLKRREAALQSSIRELTNEESTWRAKVAGLGIESMQKTIEVRDLKKALEELNGQLETAGKSLESIEAKAKQDERLQLILSMFSDKAPAVPWKQAFETMAALGGSFSGYLSSVFERSNVVEPWKAKALEEKTGKLIEAIGDILRSKK